MQAGERVRITTRGGDWEGKRGTLVKKTREEWIVEIRTKNGVYHLPFSSHEMRREPTRKRRP